MISLTTLAIVASVLVVQGDRAKLDKGLAAGLRESDRGRVHYTLNVESRPVRIDVGLAEIVQVDDFSSQARPLGSFDFRIGYALEVEIPAERLAPEAHLEIANQRLADRDYEAAAVYFEKMLELLPGDPLATRKLAEVKRLLAGGEWRDQERNRLGYYRLAARSSLEEGDLRSADSFVRKILQIDPDDEVGHQVRRRLTLLDRTANMIRIPAGRHSIGLDLGEAGFYNQQPRFEVALEEYWIDRRPVSLREFSNPAGEPSPDRTGPAAVGVSQRAAADYCRALGKRLPSEFEWEAAAPRSGFKRADGVSEWTSSWYLPYPGNLRPEPEYGERFKVVKGFSESGEFDPRLRFLMAPSEKASDVGFRCAWDNLVK